MESSGKPIYGGLEVDTRESNEQHNGLHNAYGQELKEVYHQPQPTYVPDKKVPVWQPNDESGYKHAKQIPDVEKQPPGKLRKKQWMLLSLIVLIIVIIAITVPVGVIVSRQRQSSAISSNTGDSPSSANDTVPTSVPQPSVDKVFSTQGAFNGTALTAIPPLTGQDRLWLFWQDFTGDIRLSKLNSASNWADQGSSVGIPDARNATGLAALTHWREDGNAGPTAIQHIVYTNDENCLADRITIGGASQDWVDGGLAKLKIPVPPQPSGFVAPSRLSFLATPSTSAYLYFSGSLGNINEASYNVETQVWTRGHIFDPSEGFGGVVPQFQNGVVTLRTVKPGGGFRFYWRDTKAGNTWTPAGDATGSMYSNSSMTSPVEGNDRDLVYYLNESSEITAIRTTGLRGSSEWNEQTPVGIKTSTGSTIFSLAIGNGPTEIFWQKNGDDIQYYSGSRYSFEDAGEVMVK